RDDPRPARDPTRLTPRSRQGDPVIKTIAAAALSFLVPTVALAANPTYYLHQSATPVPVPGGTTSTYLTTTSGSGSLVQATKITVDHDSTASFFYTAPAFTTAATLDAVATATVNLSANQLMRTCAQVGFSVARVSSSGTR